MTPQPPYYYPPAPQPEEKRSNTAVILLSTIAFLLVLALAGVAAYFFLFKDSSAAESEAPAMTVIEQGSSQESSEESTSNPTVTETIDVTRSNPEPKSYSSYDRDSSTTSKGFAKAVYEAFKAEYDGDPNITLRGVYSSATGKSYTMKCNEEGSRVVCRGGNAAVVYIYE